MLKDEAGGDLSDFITNGEWYLIGENLKVNVLVFHLVVTLQCATTIKAQKKRLAEFIKSNHVLRYARKEEYHHVRLLSRTVCGRYVYDNDKKKNVILFLQFDSSLCIDIFYGSSRVYTST